MKASVVEQVHGETYASISNLLCMSSDFMSPPRYQFRAAHCCYLQSNYLSTISRSTPACKRHCLMMQARAAMGSEYNARFVEFGSAQAHTLRGALLWFLDAPGSEDAPLLINITLALL